MSFLIVTPPHRVSPGLAVAAARAGETGLLDVGSGDPLDSLDAARELARLANGRNWGIRHDSLGERTLPIALLNELGVVPTLLLAGLPSAADEWQRTLTAVRPFATRVLVEVCSLSEALSAEHAGFDGLVLKGNEAGGRVAAESIFVFLQQVHGRVSVPCWAQGGIGPDTAGAAFLCGAGVVLSESLWLAREADWTPDERRAFERLDGSETVCLCRDGVQFRLFQRANRPRVQELERSAAADPGWFDALRTSLRAAPAERVVPMGQEIAFAKNLADEHGTVPAVLQAFRKRIERNQKLAQTQQALGPRSPLANRHRTEFPIVQGPMTRVSDVSPFCDAVAQNGGLPFLALALMRGPEVRTLLDETKARLGDRSWGVGILGFVPPELRREQMDVVHDVRPPFAIIAGGRPGQAKELEAVGIETYLHVPSPELLVNYIEAGARRFIFEGRECGGHVGPRGSFTLWQTALDVLERCAGGDSKDFQILFAGGIHDRLSAAMVATIAAPLVERGMKIGVLMGTSYLFTREAVESGAITAGFQKEAIACRATALLESGPGHATRCCVTPFAGEFSRHKQALVEAGKSSEEMRLELELLNVGRLRVASKGVDRPTPKDGSAERGSLRPVDPETQKREGLYMIGQVAQLRDRIVTMRTLHEDVSLGGLETLDRLGGRPLPWTPRDKRPSEPLAIVGMACLFPKANGLRQFWANIVGKVDAIEEVSPERWRPEDFYDEDRFAPDRVYSKWGSFLDDTVFDPLKFRIPPASLLSIEPIQLLSVEVAWRALKDAGYLDRSFPRDRTSVVFGVSGPHDIGLAYGFRTMMRHYLPKVAGLPDDTRTQILSSLSEQLPKWTEDSFPGFLNNVVAGRVSNHLDLLGPNFTVDAACAAALAALHVGVEQLRSGTCDVALVGACDATNNPACFMSFAKTHALSPKGRSTPFDDEADGIALGEGVAVIVLKRLADAERDGDSIYAVLRGMGSSSDGRDRSLTAPQPEGQVRALRRAYDDAGVDPRTVTLIEAHGTGTAVGDMVEATALAKVFDAPDAPPQTCALGSVKSMIGHTKTTAGLAGVIKSVLALHHRVLPPTLHVKKPNQQVNFSHSPLYINAEPRPWVDGGAEEPRRAGVSAFGFGGTNFHVVLEEYTQSAPWTRRRKMAPRPVELIRLARSTRDALRSAIEVLLKALPATEEELKTLDLAALCRAITHDESARKPEPAACRVAILTSNALDLRTRLEFAARELATRGTFEDPRGVYCSDAPAVSPAEVCFLFPGQGSQSVDMLKDLVLGAPWGTGLYARADEVLANELDQSLSRSIFPIAAFDDAQRQAQRDALNDTRVAQPALAVSSLFALDLLERFGIRPATTAGHSFGEYVALAAAGCLSRDELLLIAARRGQAIHDAVCDNPGGMAAVMASADATAEALRAASIDARIANVNSPEQTIIAGPNAGIDAALEALPRRGLRVKRIPVSAAFHTPAMQGGAERLARELAAVEIRPPRLPVFGNTRGDAYPAEPAAIRELLAQHLVEPVRFQQELEGLANAGAGIFVEVGPGNVLCGLTKSVLKDKPRAVLPLAPAGQEGWTSLGQLLGRLVALGLPVQIDAWYDDRDLANVSLVDCLTSWREENRRRPTDWLVNGSRAKPLTPLPTARPVRSDAPGASESGKAPIRWEEPAPAIVPTADIRSKPGWAPADPRPLANPRPTVAAQAATPAPKPASVAVSSRVKGPTPMVMSAHSPPAAAPPRQSENGASPAPSPGVVGQALAGFQEQMGRWLDMQQKQQELSERFLESQERIMTALLQTAGASSATPTLVVETASQVESPAHAVRTPPVPALPALRPTAASGSEPSAKLRVAPSAGFAAVSRRETSPPEASAHERNGDGPGHGARHTANGHSTNGRHATNGAASIGSVSSGAAANGAPAVVFDVTSPDFVPPAAEEFRHDLLDAVSVRTGYPVEVLDEDLALEAGLGIDSIKIVEIFSSLKRYHQFLQRQDRDEDEILTRFTQLKTLRNIVEGYRTAREEYIEAQKAGTLRGLPAPSTNGNGAAHAPHAAEVGAGERGDRLSLVTASGGAGPSARLSQPARTTRIEPELRSQPATAVVERPIVVPVSRPEPAPMPAAPPVVVERCVLAAVPAPIGTDLDIPERHAPEDLFLVLGEVPALSEALQPFLTDSDNRVRIVLPGRETRSLGGPRYECDFSSRESVAAMRRMIVGETGRIGGLINLFGVAPEFAGSDFAPDAPAKLGTWLLHVFQEFEADLVASAKTGGGLLFNVTSLGGRFGLQPGCSERAEDAPNAPSTEAGRLPTGNAAGSGLPLAQSITLGMFKTLAREWPGVRIKNIDLDVTADPERLLSHFFAELATKDESQEVGIAAEGRCRLELVDEPLRPDDLGPLPVDRDSVILATGGAVGITADVCLALAKEARPTLVLLGRTPADDAEPSETRSLPDEAALRRRLLSTGVRGERTPAAIEREVKRIVRHRRVRANLAAMRDAGARVEYHAVDVRDGDALGRIVDDVLARHGRIDGILHGAGVVEDKRLRDKTAASLRSVFDTKIDSARVLARRVPLEPLKFFVLFSSVVGRFGNAGQIDYSGANEFLNKLACDLKRKTPGRVVAINWGPWDAGMVSDELRRLYARQGIELVPKAAGVKACLDELRSLRRDRPEVLISASVKAIASVGRKGGERHEP